MIRRQQLKIPPNGSIKEEDIEVDIQVDGQSSERSLRRYMGSKLKKNYLW